MDRRLLLRIFISSTAIDLREYRDKVRDAVLRLESLPIAMETFSAQSGHPARECMRMAAEADAVICVVAYRYGYVPPSDLGGDGERCITWLEVDAAKRAGKPVFVFMVDPKAHWTEVKEQDRLLTEPPDMTREIVNAVQKLKEFKAYLAREHVRNVFSTADELAKLVTATLANYVQQRDRAVSAESAFPRYYFAVQSRIIQEQGRTFVGRRYALNAFVKFLNKEKRGYFFVRGAPGQGKTALSCHLIHQGGYVHHLIHRTGGRNDSRLILRSLVGQLLSLLRRTEKPSESISELTKDFEELLSAAVAGQGQVVIVMDALDELPPDVDNNFAQVITTALPDGAFFFVTSRPTERLDKTIERISTIPHEVYELGPLTLEEMREILQSNSPQISKSEVERIAESSQGNPLYLRAVVNQLESNPAYDLQTLPAAIEGFFRSSVASISVGNTVLAEVLGVLSAARASLSVLELGQITGNTLRRTFEEGIRPIQEFLLEIDDSFTFYHNRFHEFVTNTVLYPDELRRCHRRIADWLQLPENHAHKYRWDSLAYHLFKSGSFDELIKLIDAQFLAEKVKRFGYAVLEDIELRSRVQLQRDDPTVVENSVALVERLRQLVGGDVLDFAAVVQPYQAGPKSFRTRLVAPRVQSTSGLDVYAAILPKGDVAADFFEAVPIDDTLMIAVGDAPSVGLKSAFVARFIGNLFRKLITAQSLEVGNILSKISAALAGYDYFDRVSMQCVEICPKNRIMKLANAGHPYPVHYSSRRRKCDILPLQGNLIHSSVQAGSDPEVPYEQYQVSIGPGDVIVLITDGLTEDHVMHGDPYGYRFTTIVESLAKERSETIGEAIMDDWRVHPREHDAGDDVSVIVIRLLDFAINIRH